jgi:hypothetical protein
LIGTEASTSQLEPQKSPDKTKRARTFAFKLSATVDGVGGTTNIKPSDLFDAGNARNELKTVDKALRA